MAPRSARRLLQAASLLLVTYSLAVAERIVIVVPCYNEEERLPAAQYLEFLQQPASAGVFFLFVNDGSQDGTLAALQRLKADAESQLGSSRVDVLDLQPNGGKAEAVRRGMVLALDSHLGVAASEDVVGFWDGDLATPLAAIHDLLGVLRGAEEGPGRPRCGPAGEGCVGEDGKKVLPLVDMVFGARVGLLGRDVTRSMARHYLGRVFATLASLLLRIPIYDTQCGAKLFRATPQLREAVHLPFEAGWIFDVELLARLKRAYAARGKSALQDVIFEYPLHRWHDLPGSKLGFRAKVGALWGLARIWYEHLSPWSGPWPSPGVPRPPAAASEPSQPEL